MKATTVLLDRRLVFVCVCALVCVCLRICPFLHQKSFFGKGIFSSKREVVGRVQTGLQEQTQRLHFPEAQGLIPHQRLQLGTVRWREKFSICSLFCCAQSVHPVSACGVYHRECTTCNSFLCKRTKNGSIVIASC